MGAWRNRTFINTRCWRCRKRRLSKFISWKPTTRRQAWANRHCRRFCRRFVTRYSRRRASEFGRCRSRSRASASR